MDIYIVEDEKVTYMHLKMILERYGHKVIGNTGCGEEAIKEIIALKPDLVFMDIILLDDIDGIEVVEMCRKHIKSLNVVFLTALSNRKIEERIMKTPYKGLFHKPLNERKIKGMLEEIEEELLAESKP